MRGEITRNILEAILETVGDTATVFEAMLIAGYGASTGKMQKTFYKLKSERERAASRQALQQRYYMMLNKLKNEGFITERKSGAHRSFKVTPRGKKKLMDIKNHGSALPHHRYQKEKDGSLMIVAFDIPESERRKRNWLRCALRDLGFAKIQQSVWMGKIKLPEQFIHDLEYCKLIEYVHIFEITKSGTLINTPLSD